MTNKSKIRAYATDCEWIDEGIEVRVEKLYSNENHFAFLNSICKVLRNLGIEFEKNSWEGKNFAVLVLDFDNSPKKDYKMAKRLIRHWKTFDWKDTCCTQCAVDYWFKMWKMAWNAPNKNIS